ncbi:MAG: c-type cytochrome [Bacteroidota bacterium]
MKQFTTIITMLICLQILSAQQWQWPDKPKNITALPSSIGGRDLQRTMFSFTGSLGVRCTYCHVGEEGKDFKDFDFVSDAKPAKNKARMMIKMVKEINGKFLADFHNDNSASIQVNCQTCHRGNSTPIALEDKLKQTFDAAGIDSTIKQYRALREQFYGGFTYNFKEGTLLRLADKIYADSTKRQAALDVVNLNIEMYPAFAFSYTHLASYYEDMGNKQAAIESYQKAIAVNPKNEILKKQLERLQNGK